MLLTLQFRSPMSLDRQHLRFTAELGKGWFGFVLRGTLLNMSNTFEPNYNYEELRTPVIDNAARYFSGLYFKNYRNGKVQKLYF